MKTIKIQIKLVTLLAALISFTHDSGAQYKINDYDFPLPSVDFAASVIQKTDGGFAVAGYSYSYPPGLTERGYDWFFMELKNDGTVKRTKLVGFTRRTRDADHCFSITQLGSDLNYVLAGRMTHTDGKNKATFVKLNKYGNVMVSKRINDTLKHEYRQVIKGPGDTLVFAGFTQEIVGGGTPNKILVGRYTPDGTRHWIYRYAESMSFNIERAYSVCYQGTDKSYAVASSYGSQRIVILKLNRLGQILAQRTFGFPNACNYITEARKIIPMPDGGFVVIGFTQAFDDIAMDIWVLRVESDLDVVWSETYGMFGEYEEGHSIILDGENLVFTGFTGRSDKEMLMVKISDDGGAPLWSKVFSWEGRNAGNEIISSVLSGSDAYTVAGYKWVPVGTSFDAFLVNSDTNGEIPGTSCLENHEIPNVEHIPVIASPNFRRKSKYDVEWSPTVRTVGVGLTTICEGGDFLAGPGRNETPVRFSLKQNYPNPFNPSTKIRFSVPSGGVVSLKIYDIVGKEIAVLINEYKDKGQYELEFNAVNLPSGAYLYKLESNGYSDTKKMLLVK